MKVSELIKVLTQLKDKEGDLEVYVGADHGRHSMENYWVEVSYIEHVESHMPAFIHEHDLEEWEDPVKIIQIQGY